MDFHPEARLILRRATQLALMQSASEVTVDHLLHDSLERESSGSYALKDIPFHSKVLDILEVAAEFADGEDLQVIDRNHLESAILRETGRLPTWGLGRDSDLVMDLVAEGLQIHGVDVAALRLNLRGLVIADCRPDLEFYSSEAGRSYQRVVSRLADGRNTGLLILLGYLRSQGRASAILEQAGVTDELVVEILQNQTPPPPVSDRGQIRRLFENHGPPVDFWGCLGPGLERLDPDCRIALKLAWLSRDRDELKSNDLLRGLLGNSDLNDPDSVLSHLLRLLPGGRLPVYLTDLKLRGQVGEPSISPELYRIFAMAFEAPGPVTPIRLLSALVQAGHPILRGITPDQLS